MKPPVVGTSCAAVLAGRRCYGIGYYEPTLIPSIVNVEPTTSDLGAIVNEMRDTGLQQQDWAVFRASSSNADQVNAALTWLADRGYAFDWQLGLALVTPPATC